MEIDLADFPMLPRDKEQDELIISYAQTIEGRNYIKENYKRRKSMIRYFKKVKQEAKRLIQLIIASLEREK